MSIFLANARISLDAPPFFDNICRRFAGMGGESENFYFGFAGFTETDVDCGIVHEEKEKSGNAL
jgi:hypothetical protein